MLGVLFFSHLRSLPFCHVLLPFPGLGILGAVRLICLMGAGWKPSPIPFQVGTMLVQARVARMRDDRRVELQVALAPQIGPRCTGHLRSWPPASSGR